MGQVNTMDYDLENLVEGTELNKKFATNYQDYQGRLGPYQFRFGRHRFGNYRYGNYSS